MMNYAISKRRNCRKFRGKTFYVSTIPIRCLIHIGRYNHLSCHLTGEQINLPYLADHCWTELRASVIAYWYQDDTEMYPLNRIFLPAHPQIYVIKSHRTGEEESLAVAAVQLLDLG